MARITKDYDNHSKDELLKETQARGLSGINAGSPKDEIAKALKDDDGPDQPKAPLPKIAKSNLPHVDPPEIPSVPGDAPKDEEYTDGLATKDGEDYAVAIVEDAPNGRTHFAKNTLHFWNGTAEEFKAQFEKK